MNHNVCIAKITKLPDSFDPNVIIKEKVREKYGTKCPFCGETNRPYWKDNKKINGIFCPTYQTWYSTESELDSNLFSLNRLFTKKRHWRVDNYHCYNCGCNWNTPPYPTDIVNEKDLYKISQKLFAL